MPGVVLIQGDKLLSCNAGSAEAPKLHRLPGLTKSHTARGIVGEQALLSALKSRLPMATSFLDLPPLRHPPLLVLAFALGQVAGHDTTSFMMASAIYFLAANPEARRKLIAEVDAFGRAPPSHEDLERFPFVEVRRLWVGGDNALYAVVCGGMDTCTTVSRQHQHAPQPHNSHPRTFLPTPRRPCKRRCASTLLAG